MERTEIMERIKFKIHQLKQKHWEFWKSVKTNIQNKCIMIKKKIRKMVHDYERKHGYAERCEWCPENVLCTQYQEMPKKRHFWEIQRCEEHVSTR